MADLSRRRMLAVAFGPRTMADACPGLARIREQADCVELRLDYFEEPFDLGVLLRERGALPVIATLRPPDEGGRSKLSADARLKVLLYAAELGADYVDLEWNASTPAAVAALRAAGASVIVSRHDFSGMPDGLANGWAAQLAELGADVVKVVGTARNVCDGLEIFRVLARADRPTIALAMGEPGVMTRVLALRSDACVLTYAALDAGGATAPGQLTVEELRRTYRVERLGPSTRVFGLLGPHLEVDRLAEYNAWFADENYDGVAAPFVATERAATIVSAYRELPVSGWHIHGAEPQHDVLRALDALSPRAKQQGKANAVVRNADASLVGDWVESPREQFELWRG